MPRDGKDTREKILAAARQQLTRENEGRFSMRSIASQCGVSAGTIYIHFPDKDSLMAAVMIEDWHQTLAVMERRSHRAVTFIRGIAGIYNAVKDFISDYEKIWMEYRVAGNYAVMQSRRHREIINEISVYVRILLERFAQEKDLNMDRILAENILAAALQEEITLETLLQLAAYIAD